MKNQYISELTNGSIINSAFVVSKKQISQKKDGSSYCRLELQDKSGKIKGVLWTETLERTKDFEVGDYVFVRGEVSIYGDELQANILTLQKIQDLKKVDLSDFIRTCPKDVEEMFSRLLSLIRSMKNPFLRDLLQKFFLDESFSDSFKKAAAAITYHHSYSGGLLEHTISVCETCDYMAGKYGNINRDLALAGAILHDIAKVHEYKVGVVIEMTDEGKLLGHIAMGYQMVAEKINEIEFFPADLRTHLLHILLSHHGQKESGSPRCPQTLEAFLVYHADTLDADIGSFNLLMGESPNSDWSRYAKNFERAVYLKFISDQAYKEGDTEAESGLNMTGHKINDQWPEKEDLLFVPDKNGGDDSTPGTDLF